MKRENRGGAPLAGLTIAVIFLLSMAGYVSALSRVFQAPFVSQAGQSHFQVDDGFGLRAQEEKAAHQSLARTAPAWLLNALPGYTSSQAREKWYLSLDRSRDRFGLDFSDGSMKAPASGSYIAFNQDLFGVLAPVAGFGFSNRGISGTTAPSAPTVTAIIAWDGGTTGSGTAWLTNTNWAGDVLPDADDIAQFAAAGTATTIGINMNGATNNGANNEAVGAIELLSTRNRTIGDSSTTAGTLTLNGATVNGIANTILRNASTFLLTLQNNGGAAGIMDVALGNATDNVINIDSTGGITISSVIKNGAGNHITLGGAGTGILTLSGANLFTGGVTINSTTLRAGSTTALGPAASATLTFGSSSTGKFQLFGFDTTVIDLNSNTLSPGTPVIENGAAGTATLTVNTTGVDAFGGVLQNGAAGTLALTKSGSGFLTLKGTNTYSGDTQINAGDLRFDAGGTSNNSTFRLGATSGSNSATLSLGFVPGQNLASPLEVRSGSSGTKVLRSLNTSGTNTYSGSITLNDNLTVEAATDGTFLFANAGSNSINLTNKILTVDSQNDQNGSDNVNFRGTVQINELISGTGGSIVKDGSGILLLQGTSNTYTGGTTIRGGTVGIYGDGSLGAAPGAAANNVFFAASAASNPTATHILQDTSGDVSLAATRNINIASGITGTFDSNGNTFTINGVINGTGGNLNKIGAGTLVLTGANTYTGSTTINAGKLEAAGAGSNQALGETSGITVNAGGTLLQTSSDQINDVAGMTLNGGTYKLNGGVAEGTTSAPGLGSLTLASNSIINLAGTDVLHFSTSSLQSWTPGTVLSIYNWTGNPIVGGGAEQILFGTDPTGLNAAQLASIQFYSGEGTGAYTMGAIILVDGEIVPVPEPSTWIGAALALGAIGLTQRKRFVKRFRVIG